MKKLFFLFAAAALLTACSSDELSETTGGGGTTTNPDTEQYVSSNTVEFTNGTAISVGALDENGVPTRAEESVNFTIDLNKLENDVLKGLSDYVLKTDDFAIRVNGDYLEGVEPVEGENKVENSSILVSENDLSISVSDLQNLEFTKEINDYTFEVYLWIENKKLLNDGTGGYGELFTDSIKMVWINNVWPVVDDKAPGYDLSFDIWRAYADNTKFTDFVPGNSADIIANYADYNGRDFFNTSEGGLLVRYNVYRGLQGKNGDTPYIKVSIHVEQQDQTTVGNKGNQATWVSIPYTPHKSLSKDSSDILSVK